MSKPLVLIAHEERAIRDAALHAVAGAGYEGVAVPDGDRALEVLISNPTPAALVVDVALRGKAGYELCDEISTRRLPTKVVLIASVYSRTAYKRQPTSLYGADDYVEQHHVVDMLPAKLAKLVPPPQLPRARSVHDRGSLTAEEAANADRIRAVGDARMTEDYGHAGAVERAQQLAKLIVSDVVLYNGTAVEAWVRARGESALRKLPTRILRDLDEARRLFAEGTPDDVTRGRDYVLEALMEFLDSRE